jgi:hypothetical protein
MQAKNADYSAGDDDALRNFKTAKLVNLDPKHILLANIVNKVSRIGNLLTKEAAVQTEKIDDTILDLVNYSILLLAYLHDTNPHT